MVDISERLIPYKDEKDLASRVASLFDWEQIGDSLPREFSTNPKLPQGVILSYPRESFAFSYNPLEELCDIVRYFPPESDIVKEIIKQGEENLKEILSKSRETLKSHNPRYLNTFTACGDVGALERLFNPMLQAARHIIDLRILTNDIPLRESEILLGAVKGIVSYIPAHPAETKNFFEYLWKKRLVLPFVVRAYTDLEDIKGIDIYFEILRTANGKEDFIMDGIQRSFSFEYLGKCLQRKFPNHDFENNYQDVQDQKLRSQLGKIFVKK